MRSGGHHDQVRTLFQVSNHQLPPAASYDRKQREESSLLTHLKALISFMGAPSS